MKSRTFPVFLGLLIAGIAFVNMLAIHYAWYWSIRWLDMPMHFLGGVWLAGSVLWFRFKTYPPQRYSRVFLWGIGGAVGAGVVWEIYESLVSLIATGHILSIYDSLSDIFFDFLGGALISILVVLVMKNNK